MKSGARESSLEEPRPTVAPELMSNIATGKCTRLKGMSAVSNLGLNTGSART